MFKRGRVSHVILIRIPGTCLCYSLFPKHHSFCNGCLFDGNCVMILIILIVIPAKCIPGRIFMPPERYTRYLIHIYGPIIRRDLAFTPFFLNYFVLEIAGYSLSLLRLHPENKSIVLCLFLSLLLLTRTVYSHSAGRLHAAKRGVPFVGDWHRWVYERFWHCRQSSHRWRGATTCTLW